ncbi:hypothetical protein LY39_02077 [Roseinatronobacter bogoriensis subsp. barguzinensis]|nr:hypothetical protein LY39_02077 [Rhodobaca barguzinensis]
MKHWCIIARMSQRRLDRRQRIASCGQIVRVADAGRIAAATADLAVGYVSYGNLQHRSGFRPLRLKANAYVLFMQVGAARARLQRVFTGDMRGSRRHAKDVEYAAPPMRPVMAAQGLGDILRPDA